MKNHKHMLWFVLLGIFLSVGIAGVFLRPKQPDWRMSPVPVQTAATSTTPQFTSTSLPTSANVNHASNIIALADGTRLAVWFAGSREGAGDVQLLLASQQNGVWAQAEVIQTIDGFKRAVGQYSKKIGNPVIFAGQDHQIHLIFVTVALGGWGGSRLAHSVSADQGRTWSPPNLWVTEPFLNISTQIRNPPLPIQLSDGKPGWLLPVHHEFILKFPALLVLDEQGEFLYKARIPAGRNLIQPALATMPGGELRAYFRATEDQKRVMTSVYNNDWSDSAQALSLPNPNAAVAVVSLADQRLLMAYNPTTETRDKLALALSDDGVTWQQIAEVENGSRDKEYSYPSLTVHGDEIDLTYTHLRQSIKHAHFNVAWLNQQLRNHTVAH
jgi:predicted neuraminidase